MRFRLVTAASLLALAACTTASQLAAYPGVEGQIRSYYERHAMERNGSCTMPRIQAITRATPIRDTPDELVLEVRYRFEPFNQIQDFGRLSCRDWGQRSFAFRKINGALQLTEMSGTQRR